MPGRFVRTVSVLLAVSLATLACGDDDLPLPQDPLGHALWQDLSDGRLDRHDLLQAALLAGGVTEPGRLQRCTARFQKLVQRCDVQLQDEANRELAPAVVLFHTLHTTALSGPFREDAWQVEQALRGGPFNCVTSAVLYLCLCDHYDIKATAIAQRHHVYCRLKDDTGMDVQTTCKDWFDSRGIPQQAALRNAGRPAGQPREIDNAQLLGKIYFNRATALNAAQRYRASIDHLRRAVYLDDQDEAARENLLAAMNNGALQLSDAGRYRLATRLICQGLNMSPRHDELLANDLHIHQQWALHLCRTGRFADALQLLEDCHVRRRDVELFDSGRWCVYRSWGESLLERERVSEARDLFASAHARYGDHPELRISETAVWSSYRNSLANTGRKAARPFEEPGNDLTAREILT